MSVRTARTDGGVGELVRLTRDEARRRLVEHLGLRRSVPARGAAGLRAVLASLRAIQLDPLDPMGTNADLVALARVDGIRRGDVYRHLLGGHAFEHFAKERCLLPVDTFPQYREAAAETLWWRMKERLARVPEATVEAVRREVLARGPVTVSELSDRGRVAPLDWNGWKGTSRATRMALEILWTRCDVVVCGRVGRDKRYDVPARALGEVASRKAVEPFARFAVRERVSACGLLSRAGGATWSVLSKVRTSGLVEEMLAEGALCEVSVEGSSRRYLTSHEFLTRPLGRHDARMRILGPLDPLLWDRGLVRELFDFDYVWEVYKPPAARRFGWYVCPLLHRGRLVGRLEGRVDGERLCIDRIWAERAGVLDETALGAALERHARACGATRVSRCRRVLSAG